MGRTLVGHILIAACNATDSQNLGALEGEHYISLGHCSGEPEDFGTPPARIFVVLLHECLNLVARGLIILQV